MRVQVCYTVSGQTYWRLFNLPECPLVGDEVWVWNKDNTNGIVMEVYKRSWQSNGNAVELHCNSAAEPTTQYLKTLGFK